jgi:hypothetical protein
VQPLGRRTKWIAIEIVALAPHVVDHALPGRTFGHHFGRQIEQLHGAAIADRDPLIGADHQDALVHVLQRRFEQRTSCLQVSGALVDKPLQIAVEAGKLFLRLLDDALAVTRKLPDLLIEFGGARRQTAVGDGTDQTHSENSNRGSSNRDGKRGGRQRIGRNHAGRIRDHFNRAHGGEMMGYDRKRKQQRGRHGAAHVFTADCHGERCHSEQYAERDRDADQIERPGYPAWYFKRPHAEIMHAGDAGPNDAAADHGAPSIGPVDGDAQTSSGDRRRDQQRQ